MKKRRKWWTSAVVAGVWVWLLLPVVVAALQLPPEIQADRYLLEAEKKIQEQNFEGAKDAMDRILKLEVQHGLEIPEEFFFRYAEVSERLGLYEEVVDFVTKYLTLAGRDAKHYRKALELLSAAEQIVEAARRKAEAQKRRAEAAAEAARRKAEAQKRRAEAVAGAGAVPTCDGQPKGSACWMELEGRSIVCFVWDTYFLPDEVATWTGKCSGGLAHGMGTITVVWDGGKNTLEATGSLTEGKRHGDWVVRWGDGRVAEGPYVDGKRHGNWVVHTLYSGVFEGPYVDGKAHGDWIVRWGNGGVSEGPYVDGKRHGDWVERRENGDVYVGSYVDGKRQDGWVLRNRKGKQK